MALRGTLLSYMGIVVLSAGSMLTCKGPPFTSYPFCDETLDTETRITDALNRMPLAEKLNMMTTAFESEFVACGPNNGIPSLGISAAPLHSECLHGVLEGCIGGANGTTVCPTSFPNGGMLGASFNRTLWRSVGNVIGTQRRAMANMGGGPSGYACWAPDLNLLRDPRWGRAQEVPSEDPFHTGEYGVAFISGMQSGDDVRYTLTLAEPKHFAAYDLEGLGPNNVTGLCTATGRPLDNVCRYSYDGAISGRDLVEYYLSAWAQVLTRADVRSVMCSYVAINGVPSCANSWLLNDVARGQWGFDGYVVSDCLALQVMMQDHAYLPYDVPVAAAAALNAGTDFNCGCVLQNGTAEAIARGLVNESVVNASVTRILRTLYQLGEFDANVPYRSYGQESMDNAEQQQLAYEAALQGMVLLQNDGALPLQLQNKQGQPNPIAFIGPNANRWQTMLSSYAGQSIIAQSNTPLQTAQRDPGANITFAQGCNIDDGNTGMIPAAVALAQSSYAAVLFMGLDYQEESEWGNAPDCVNDRQSLRLPGVQEQLILAVAATGTPTIVVLMNGGAISVENWYRNVSAIVEAYYPGEIGGPAILAQLTGAENRWGALSATMYFNNITQRDYYVPEAMGLDYEGGITHLWFTGEPEFPYGFGLSYTTFSYAWDNSTLSMLQRGFDVAELVSSDGLPLSVNITNTGARAGDAIPLAFVYGPAPDYPLQRLFDFDRVTIQPGETVQVQFFAAPHELAGVREDGTRWLNPSTPLRLRIGSPRGPGVEASVLLRGSAPAQLSVFAGVDAVALPPRR